MTSVLLLWALDLGPAGHLWGVHSLAVGDLLQLRGWRSLLALAEGSALAACGLVMQSLFRNPLVDASLLGVSQAAALGLALGLVVGWPVAMQHLLAAGCAFIVLTLLMGLMRQFRYAGLGLVLLLGLALNALLGAGLQLMLAWMPASALQGVMGFLQGSFAQAGGQDVLVVWCSTLVMVLAIYHYRRQLDLMLLGSEAARTAGVDSEQLQAVFILLSAVVVAILVRYAGVIGFVGMMAPALVRWRLSGGHGVWLPWSLWVGASMALLADILARTLVAPAELPVGVVSSLLGAPVFILMLFSLRWQRT